MTLVKKCNRLYWLLILWLNTALNVLLQTSLLLQTQSGARIGACITFTNSVPCAFLICATEWKIIRKAFFCDMWQPFALFSVKLYRIGSSLAHFRVCDFPQALRRYAHFMWRWVDVEVGGSFAKFWHYLLLMDSIVVYRRGIVDEICARNCCYRKHSFK
jgi:hypothetical protein